MELGVILEVISTLGFPIALVIALCWFVYKIYNHSVEREAKLMGEITENRNINKQFAEIIGKYEVTLGEIKADVKDIKETLNISNE